MFVALLLALAAETAPTPDTAAAPAPATATAKAKPGDMVCVTEQVTGTRFPRKICRNKAEADQKRAEDQARLRDTQRYFNPNSK